FVNHIPSSPLILSSFFFTSCLFLSAFPTRRSSDLLFLCVHVWPPVQTQPLTAALCGSGCSDGKAGFSVSASSSICRVSLQRRVRSEEHTSELQSRFELVCSFLLEKK